MALPGLAFQALNLCRNPFGELEAHDRAALAVVEPALLERARELRRGGQALLFLGDCGRGKSTHLHALHALHPSAPLTYVGPGERPRIPAAPVVFLDEVQRLSSRRRARLFRRRASFVLGSHQDHGAELERAGLRVTTVRVGGVDAHRLEHILARRIEAARRAPGPVPRIPRDTLEALTRQFGDDLRAIEDHLYGVFQALEEVCDVKL
jgi:hypothetical protein